MTAPDSSRIYDGRPVADRRAQRRTQFLAAGLELFGASGYQDSSITALCRAAGLARSQFYEHFHNREELLLAVFDMIQEEARQAVAVAVDLTEPGDGVGWAQAAVRAYAESLGCDPRRARISQIEIVGVSERVEQHRLDQREAWMTFFADQCTRTLGPDFVPPGGYRAAATGFVGALNALVHQWSTGDSRLDLAAVTEVLTRFLTSLTSVSE
ncbi:TetR/AcrR family transcriptional regulator [Nocardia sp. NPDC051463]|uniref:TetR/AcrR family transcriptional regulator n=1 Tax=Nocardia sp. NPDC051463 TaxID=3154845 RepID=UPI00344BBC5C